MPALAAVHAADLGLLRDVLILLAGALVLGTVAERLRQSALVGYLLAGTLLGPHVLGLIDDSAGLEVVAELGVAFLLFAIGLEFSVRRLFGLGRVALVGGALQVAVTTVVFLAAWTLFGASFRAALTLGAMGAMSSTACVLRVLADRAQLDGVHGRNAVGILLVQDVAVIPLTLVVSALALPEDGGASPLAQIGKTILLGALLVGGFVILFNVLVPRLLNLRQWSVNRELPVLLAIVMAVGSAFAAGAAGLNPAIGAFLAGVLLASSPFAVQITADVAAARTVLVTIFFASVGLLADPTWAAQNVHLVLPTMLAVLAGKALIVALILWPLGVPIGAAVATGLCVAQVGEFSFVLGQIGRDGNLFSDDTFKLTTATTTLTLLATPYLVTLAPWVAARVERLRARGRPAPTADAAPAMTRGARVLIVGYGPAGQRVAEALIEHEARCGVGVIDANPRNARRAEQYGLSFFVGDASQLDVLEHAGARTAEAIVVALPDPEATRQIVLLARTLAPDAAVFARSRYHVARWEIQLAGADTVVDEEEQVGLRLAEAVRERLSGGSA